MTDFMPQEEELPKDIRIIVDSLRYQLAELRTEFRYFRNIMVTLYLTIVAPLVVAIFLNILGNHK